MQISSDVMDERNICRIFSVFNRQLTFNDLKDEDIERTKVRTQFYIEKLVDILQMRQNVEIKEVLWSNHFIKCI